MYIIDTSNGNIDVPIDALHSYMSPGDSLIAESGCIHSIKSLSIPLLVRYTLGNKKLSYYFEGGIYAGYIIRSKAEFSYDNYNPTVIDNIRGMQEYYIEFSFADRYSI